jgi:hypothetical protein
MTQRSRREFFGSIGQGMLFASLGPTLARELTGAVMPESTGLPQPGSDLEKLISLMQETPGNELQPRLVDLLRTGTELESLVTAAGLANARSFGGLDYEGYHAFMALMPAYRMSKSMPEDLRALPVLKVIYRNSSRIQEVGQIRDSVSVAEASASREPSRQEKLQELVREGNMAAAEVDFAALCSSDLDRAYDELQACVRDEVDVHRVVLPWRAWDMMQLAGTEHAQTLLGQSLRYCIDAEQGRLSRQSPPSMIRSLLPRLLDQNSILERELGSRQPEDDWVLKLSDQIYGPDRGRAAEAVVAALAEGYAPEAVGEAISLAANRLLLHNPNDPRRRGGVHGASIGVHASDAANAWRNIARVTDQRTQVASLVVAAYHTAGQSQNVNKEPLPYMERSSEFEGKSPEALLEELDARILDRDQVGACAVVQKYSELGQPAQPVFDLFLAYAVSEDGALHAEKYYWTAYEEYASMRPAFRWGQLLALARVTASEYGEPAPGYAEARKLLAS